MNDVNEIGGGTKDDGDHAQLDGRVDGFSAPRLIGGWARLGKYRSAQLVARAIDGKGNHLGEAPVCLMRPDVDSEMPCGFRILLGRDARFAEFGDGRIRVCVLENATMLGELRIGASLTAYANTAMAFDRIRHFIAKFGKDELIKLQPIRGEDNAMLVPLVESLIAGTANKDTQLSRPGRPALEAKADDLTPILIPSGLISPDKSAVLGREGFGFIYLGANRLTEMYKCEDQGHINAVTDAWQSVFSNRVDKLVESDIQYVQTIIPDKQSLIPDLYPYPLNTPTPHLAAIELRVLNEPIMANRYVSALTAFQSAMRLSVFRKMDSHLAPYGAFTLFRAFVETMGEASIDEPEFTRERIILPDLAMKFVGVPFYDIQLEAVEPEFARHRVKVDDFAPYTNHNGGRRVVWQNPAAPIGKSVIAFGNSFFSLGGFQGELSWWMSIYCKEFHFVWSPDVDFSYVQDKKPDVVICQTIERFLDKVPAS
jgi:hypothetical protein